MNSSKMENATNPINTTIMKKVILKMHDNFSGATATRNLTVPPHALAELENHQINKTVLSHFDKQAQIRYDWIIDEIEILKS